MTEVEIVKYLIQAGFAGIAAGLILVLYQIVRGNRSSESGLMKIVDRLLAGMFDRFGEIMASHREDMKALVKEMQSYQERATSEMIRQVSEYMTPTLQRRDAKENLIHADIKTIPAETQRLLQLDLAQQTENIRLAIEQTLVETERRIVTNLSQAGEAQQAVHEALAIMKTDLSSALTQLKAIHETLDRLEKQAKIIEPGEHAPAIPEASQEPKEG